jgi:hypothetical protein
MEAPANGVLSVSVSFNVTVTPASIAVAKAIQLTTSLPDLVVEQMMSGICRLYAFPAIVLKGGGFLVHHRHP